MDNSKEQVNRLKTFLKYLNKKTDNFILKGSLALDLCYFPCDCNKHIINLDAKEFEGIIEYVSDYCAEHKLSYHIGRDDNSVTKVYISDNKDSHIIKVVVFYRKANIRSEDYTVIDGIHTYRLARIVQMKAVKYATDGKLNDIYNIAYIITHFPKEISRDILNTVFDAVESQGFYYIDDLIMFQCNEDFPIKNLLDNYFSMLQKIDFYYEREDFETLCTKTQEILRENGIKW